MYEILIKVDEELVKKEQEHNVALERERERIKQEKAIAKEHKRAMAVLKEVGLMATRELVVSKVGEFARDTLLQRKIDIGMSIATTIGAFAIHPVLGAIHVATSAISQSIDYELNTQREQTRLQIMGGRAGYVNRSR